MGIADYLRTMGMSDGEKLYLFAQDTSLMLKINYKKLSPKGELEAILFSSLIVLGEYEKKYPTKYEAAKATFFNSLHKQADTLNVKAEIINMMSSRIVFYYHETDSFVNENNYIPAKLYSAFYETPLANEIKPSSDLGEILIFANLIPIIITNIKKSVNSL